MEYPTVGHFFFVFPAYLLSNTRRQKRQLREKMTTVRSIPILRYSVTGAMRTATARVRNPLFVHKTSPSFHAPKKSQFAAPPTRTNQSKSKQHRRQSIVAKRPGLASSAVSRKSSPSGLHWQVIPARERSKVKGGSSTQATGERVQCCKSGNAREEAVHKPHQNQSGERKT